MTDTITFDGLSNEQVLRQALASILGRATFGARAAANQIDRESFEAIVEAAQTALDEIKDRATFDREAVAFEAWRATQPTPSAMVAGDLPL